MGMSEFTTVNEVAPRALSLVVPAYNEANRLPSYLESVQSYFDSALGLNYEVIVVDDGSDDNTEALVREYISDWPELRYIRHRHNSGKGSALRTGAFSASGSILLFTDADGATPIECEYALRAALYGGADMATGVRYGSDLSNSRRPVRRLLSGVFRFASRFLLETAHRDSQCGFKMMPRSTARILFSLAREQGYLIDLELLTLAARLGLGIAEVPVEFRDVPGSKVALVADSWRMFVGLSRLRRDLPQRLAEIKRVGKPSKRVAW
jgi:dolichyl-phosphate beta-glucosyltransferase